MDTPRTSQYYFRRVETLDRIRWAFRKAYLPVSSNALVLDVGAGACPNPRADVLLERYMGGTHRGGTGLVADRPTVIGDALRMPFRDKAFDFAVAFHVLEHVKRPELMLNELMRVSRAGYIETPNLFLERLCPYDVHVLEVIDIGGKLHIHKKAQKGDKDFLARMNIPQDHSLWKKLFFGTPQLFHVRYFWKDSIDYQIDNPDEECAWCEEAPEEDVQPVQTYQGEGWRGLGLNVLRRYYNWRRSTKIDWLDILACPTCRQSLKPSVAGFHCANCNVDFGSQPMPNFIRPVAK